MPASYPRGINGKSEHWRFQTVKLVEFLQRRSRHGQAEVRRIVDLAGQTIAESADPIDPLVVWVGAYISQAGVQHTTTAE